MSGPGDDNPASMNNDKKKMENHKHQLSRDVPGGELWTDGLICAFGFVQGRSKAIGLRSASKFGSAQQKLEFEAQRKPGSECPSTAQSGPDLNNNHLRDSSLQVDLETSGVDTLNGQHRDIDNDYQTGRFHAQERSTGNCWIPIGWGRISELLQTVQVDAGLVSQPIEFPDDEDDVTVADVATPYWERPVGPTRWCQVAAGHPFVKAWLSNSQWLHPAISIALRDESKLIGERMKHLLYKVPVRVAGGVLFELLGQSVGDPSNEEDDIPIVLRSWQARNFLLTSLHVKGSSSNVNVLGIAEVQEPLAAGGSNVPRTIHEVIALLACHLACWDDR